MKNTRAPALCLAVIFMGCSMLFTRAALPRSEDGDDVGLSIDQTEPATFPNGLLLHGIHSGKVRIIVSVDAAGQLVDCLVVAYTNKAFVESAVRAVKVWTYEPVKVRGRARASRAVLQFDYNADLVVTVQNSAENFLQDQFGHRWAFEPSTLRNLDRIPTPIHVVSPTIPNGVMADGEERVVNVEFYIDQEGKVRVPAVSREEADDRLAAAAVTAVEQWRFEPPMRNKNPVLVLAQQEFRFVAKAK